MYTVDRIENNIIILEDRTTKEMFKEKKEILPNNIKEGDIIDYIDNKYILNSEKTENIKENIRNRFDKLKKK